MPDIEVLTIKEVAEILRTSIRTVRQLIKSKKLNAVRVGREYRILKNEVERFMSESE